MPHVIHYKRTPLALAPDALCAAIERYSDWSVELATRPDEFLPNGQTLVHWHNWWEEYSGPQLIQYHSEPTCPNLRHDFPGKKLVVAQYQATLPEYADCSPIKNLIDFRLPMFDPQQVSEFRIGYSPSITGRVNQWYDKGYAQTTAILAKLQKDFPWLQVDVITGAPYEDCIRRKAECSIIIDECVTGSYHRSGLEGLALGKFTVAWLSEAVQNVIREVTEQNEIPFFDCRMDELEASLADILREWSPEDLAWWGERSRQWMEAFWTPEEIVERLTSTYYDLLAET